MIYTSTRRPKDIDIVSIEDGVAKIYFAYDIEAIEYMNKNFFSYKISKLLLNTLDSDIYRVENILTNNYSFYFDRSVKEN